MFIWGFAPCVVGLMLFYFHRVPCGSTGFRGIWSRLDPILALPTTYVRRLGYRFEYRTSVFYSLMILRRIMAVRPAATNSRTPTEVEKPDP